MNYLALAIAYFLGAIPTGYWVGCIQGIDIREHGSGSTGATNVWRCLGRKYGILVFAVDLAKGVAAVLLTGMLLPADSAQAWWIIGAGVCALIGHSRSCWIGFRGGKSVATGLGVLLALNWQVALCALSIWGLTMAIWRTVSISSLAAAVSTPLLIWLWQSPQPYLILTIFGAMFIIWTHRANIQRLLSGQELSFNQAKETEPSQAKIS
ncbi:MAG: glycerol-3-phosphate 1-O-acyltransferase PlsY [Pseudanabaenaceae cyanobacterium bins.68]|nr:glycerol-3-phosphate 1-O-acyltransferase PlsY [Pseudanabaenaceae cyanobacterium bins.68]